MNTTEESGFSEAAKETIHGGLETLIAHKLEHLSVDQVTKHGSPSRRSTASDRTPSAGNSPANSHVSIFPPSYAVSLLPSRHFDLTPVTRNTSGAMAKEHEEYAVISPDELHGEHLLIPEPLKRQQSLIECPSLPPPPPAVEFRRFNTFTSRENYEDAVQIPVEGRTPYQPSRQVFNDDYDNGVSDEGAQQIFIHRDSDDSHRNHRLHDPILMEERQWSIPSIRLANQLNGSLTGGSCASLTEEDSLFREGDDASLSSRGSSLYFPEEAEAVVGEPLFLPARSTFHPVGLTNVTYEDAPEQQQRRKRKSERNERVYAWLQSVEADQNVLAEAASSKFLTGQFGIEQRDDPPIRQVFAPTTEPGHLMPMVSDNLEAPLSLAMHRRKAPSPPTFGNER
jgi:hypothetical protein